MFYFKQSFFRIVIFVAWCKENYALDSDVLQFIFSCALWVSVILTLLTYDYDYWIHRGIFSPPVWPVVGHIWKMATFREHSGLFFKRMYDMYKNKRLIGIHQFYRRTVVVTDPALIRRMCVNDFQHFTDRGFSFDRDLDPLAESVLYLRGNEWKALRSKISPIFSPIKLKGMLPLVDNTAKEFLTRVKKLLHEDENNNERNVKDNGNVATCFDDKVSCGEIGLHTNDAIEGKSIDDKVNGEKLYGYTADVVKRNITDADKVKCDKMFERYSVKTIERNIKDDGKAVSYVNGKMISHNGKAETCWNGKAVSCCNGKAVSCGEDNGKACCNGTVVSCGEMFGGYTADAIVPCAFGVKSHVMENPEDPFAVALRAYYEFTLRNVLEKSLHYFWPAFAMFMKIRIIPKKTHDFFYNIVTNVIRERQNGIHDKRGDFIDMMMALQNDEKNHNILVKDDVRITDMIISANAFIIFLGGFETTSSTLAFMLLELAEHPEVQMKMRAEIQAVLARHGGRISYETLQDLTYMEMVIQETLRLYPPFPAIQRQCRRRYTIHTDGQTDVTIEPDTLVIFPTLGLHRDEQYFENASSFIPERWAEGQPPPPPGVYMPFGEGPRYCIGKRFAIIQMKCCLVKLLQYVKISPAPGRQYKSDSESCTQNTNVKPDLESTHSNSGLKSDSYSRISANSESIHSSSGVKSDFESNTHYSRTSSERKSSRREPFPADVRCPMTLHPADSRVTLSLL